MGKIIQCKWIFPDYILKGIRADENQLASLLSPYPESLGSLYVYESKMYF